MAQENLPDFGGLLSNEDNAEYKLLLDQAIKDMGEPIVLHMPGKKIDCPNCTVFSNRGRVSGRRFTTDGPQPFAAGGRCPWCKNKGYLMDEKEIINYTALIDEDYNDIEFGPMQTRSNRNEIFVTTQVVARADMDRAESMEYQSTHYRLKQGSFNVGLITKHFLESTWERIDSK